MPDSLQSSTRTGLSCPHHPGRSAWSSLKAKLRAWAGKCLMTLARLPCQKDRTPCSLQVWIMQSIMPLYCLSAVTCLLECCTCNSSSLTCLMGITMILEMAVASPPTRKSLEVKETAASVRLKGKRRRATAWYWILQLWLILFDVFYLFAEVSLRSSTLPKPIKYLYEHYFEFRIKHIAYLSFT